MKIALYAGSFDPITYGHLDIVKQALTTFDEVRIGVGVNPSKNGLFTLPERIALIERAIGEALLDVNRIRVESFEGSLARHVKNEGLTHIVRGLRQVSDFNDEFTLHGALEEIAPEIPIAYFICAAKRLHVSSSTARQLAALDEPMGWLVTPSVERALMEKFR